MWPNVIRIVAAVAWFAAEPAAVSGEALVPPRAPAREQTPVARRPAPRGLRRRAAASQRTASHVGWIALTGHGFSYKCKVLGLQRELMRIPRRAVGMSPRALRSTSIQLRTDFPNLGGTGGFGVDQHSSCCAASCRNSFATSYAIR